MTCLLPGCGVQLPSRGGRGRPRLYCCDSHRVRAAYLRSVEHKGLALAMDLTEGLQRASDAAQVSASEATADLERVLELAATLVDTTTELEKLTGGMVERTRKATLAMPNISPRDLNAEVEKFKLIGKIRERLRSQAQELTDERDRLLGTR